MKTIIALKVRTIVNSWSLGNFNQDMGIKMVWLNFRLFPWEMQKMHFFHPKSCSNKIRKFPKVTKAEYQSLRINHLLKKFIGITVRNFLKCLRNCLLDERIDTRKMEVAFEIWNSSISIRKMVNHVHTYLRF